uniref:Transposase n=1 Tax=Macrostomum lignano TaxID=282301 RepID=A0A1I8FU05_9PLAT
MKVFRHDRRNSVVLHIAGAKLPGGQAVAMQPPKTSASLHL